MCTQWEMAKNNRYVVFIFMTKLSQPVCQHFACTTLEIDENHYRNTRTQRAFAMTDLSNAMPIVYEARRLY